MASTTSPSKINVAVIGGGMGGLSCAIGLLKIPHLDVQIYEGAHQFAEIGAGVAFGPNAQRALHLIGPETEQAYLAVATHNGWPELRKNWSEFRYGTGDDREGQLIADPYNETGQATAHRAKLLAEFVKLVPAERAHFGKRLERIEDVPGAPVKLFFKDGTEAEADCVIGADGVHSVVRKHLLGPDHPALLPTFTGSVAYRGLIPMQTAIATLGSRYAENSMIWMGHGGAIMTYPIDFGQTCNVVAITSTYDTWEGAWVQKADPAKIAAEFAHFGPHVHKIVDLLSAPEVNVAVWSMWDHPRAPTYCKDRVVMLGDAAHASTPFQGQGAGQAIEDAYVLTSLFQETPNMDDLPLAFQAYDAIRRPRSQMVCKTSREAGELLALRLPGVEDNEQALRENISWRMDWMWHRDVAGERVEALGVLERLLERRERERAEGKA